MNTHLIGNRPNRPHMYRCWNLKKSLIQLELL